MNVCPVSRKSARRRGRALSYLALLLCLSLLFSAFSTALAAETSAKPDYDALYRLFELDKLIYTYSIDSQSDDPLGDALAKILAEDPTLYRKLVNLMISDLDRYSHYFTKEEYAEAFPSLEPYVGIGIIIRADIRRGLFVSSLVAGGPAQKAGLLPGDQIISVDGKDISLLPYEESMDLFLGEENSVVKLKVVRDGEKNILDFSITRASMRTTNVSFEDLGGGVAYITIDRFEDAFDYAEFVSIYNRLPYEGFRSVMIDLRGNPGGDMNVLLHFLNAIVMKQKEPLFAIQQALYGFNLFESSGAAIWKPNALVLLVDEYTASAAEVMAGSLSQLNLCTLVGTKTYGKGRGQIHSELENGDVAVITVMDVVLPDGNRYDGVGITPKHVVKLEERLPDVKLLPLDAERALLSTAFGPRVYALEQRLSLLGYMAASPDMTFGLATRYALCAFAKDHNLPQSSTASIALLRVLEAETQAFLKKPVLIDTQFAAAMDIARKAAEKPLEVTPPPKADWDATTKTGATGSGRVPEVLRTGSARVA